MLQPLPRNASLITQTTQALREALEQGKFDAELPGERQLCERLRVSRPTVRSALAQLATERWIAVAHGKPCRVLRPPAAPAQSANPRLLMLSPVVAGEMPPFTTLWMDELRERLGAAGISMELHVHRGAFSARPARALETLTRRHPEAIWLLYLATAPMQRWFHERGLPCLLAGTCAPGVALPSVDIDHRAACRHAGGVLLKAGRRRLALLLPEGERGGDRESEAGIVEAASSSPLKPAPPQIIRHEGTVKSLRRELDRLLTQRPPVDGLVVARSHHALTAITHLVHRGVNVPRDIAVISRDDDAFLGHVVPEVARYASDPVKFATQLARITLPLLQDRSTPARTIRLMPDLIRGETLT